MNETMEYFFVLLVLVLSAAFVFGGLATSYLLAPHRPGRIKNTPYECGMIPVGRGGSRFSVKFYLVAMLFILFDIEVVFSVSMGDSL
jgi:NADH-quinone oxidoreductase subunit A